MQLIDLQALLTKIKFIRQIQCHETLEHVASYLLVNQSLSEVLDYLCGFGLRMAFAELRDTRCLSEVPGKLICSAFKELRRTPKVVSDEHVVLLQNFDVL
jgi:hypothetical protein